MGLGLRGKSQAVQQIGSGVRHRQVYGLLSSGDHNGLGTVLHQIRQCGRRESHGICAMANDKSVIIRKIFLHKARQLQPMPSIEIRAVQTEGLQHIHGTEIFVFLHIAQQIPCLNLGRQPFLGISGGYGPSGGYQQYPFHPLFCSHPFTNAAASSGSSSCLGANSSEARYA